jgi:hypothetical protein
MGLLAGRGHQVVVEVAENPLEPLQYLVHQSLERLLTVAESEGHPGILEQSKRCYDGRLTNIGWMHRYLMVPLLKIRFAKNIASSQPSGEVLHPGQRILVRNSDEVESPEITARPARSIRFAHHVEGRGLTAAGPANYALLLQPRKLLLGCSIPLWAQSPEPRQDRPS